MANSRATHFLAARDFLLKHRVDYAAARAGFRWPALREFNWALDYFDAMAAGNELPALQIVFEDGRHDTLSFDQLRQRSNQVANWLRRLGVRRGDRVLLMLGNDRELWETMLAAIKLGAVIVPATTLLATADVADRFARGHVRHVVATTACADKFVDLPGTYTRIGVGPAVDGWRPFADAYAEPPDFIPDGVTHADDPLLLYFTSGTTSKPKLVLHTHQSYPIGHLTTMYWIGLQPGDIHLNISSPGWAKHAWSCFFAPWNAGACVFIYNYTRFDGTALLDVLKAHGVTVLCAPPTVWRMLIQLDLSRWPLRLREVVSAGEPLNPEVIETVRRAWGLTIRDGYGQTETTCQIGNSPGQAVKPGSMGRPMPGYRVELITGGGYATSSGESTFRVGDRDVATSDDRDSSTSGTEGEICLPLADRPLGLMQEYADDAGKTSEAMRGGAYHTGDVATQDDEGYITYVGRADDVFKASDYRISPFELESVLIEHAAVAEAAVVPSADPLRLAVPKAFVVCAAGFTPSGELAQDILRFCRTRLAPYQRIRRIEFAELPKTISGKIRRNELRAREAARRAAGEREALEFFDDEIEREPRS